MMYFNEALRLLRLFSFDFLLWIVSFLVTVIWGAMEGKVLSCTSNQSKLVLVSRFFPRTGGVSYKLCYPSYVLDVVYTNQNLYSKRSVAVLAAGSGYS